MISMTKSSSSQEMSRNRDMAHVPGIANIDIINESTVVDDKTVRQFTADLQIQLDRDYAAFWGATAKLNFIPKGHKANHLHWWQVVFDTTDQPGALGYHTVTQRGQPIGYTFAKTDIAYNEEPSTTLSHELLEMMADPDTNKIATVELADTHRQRQYAYENCDAVETLSYKIGSTPVSNFVTPQWFITSSPDGTQFDYMNKVSQPFQLLQGGYISYNDGDGWKQITAQLPTPDKLALLRPDSRTTEGGANRTLFRTYIINSEEEYFEYRKLPHQYSRRMKRSIPRHQWIKSTAHK